MLPRSVWVVVLWSALAETGRASAGRSVITFDGCGGIAKACLQMLGGSVSRAVVRWSAGLICHRDGRFAGPVVVVWSAGLVTKRA